MHDSRGRKPGWQKQLAQERIAILFAEAEKAFDRHPERSRRYVQLAKRIGMRYTVRLPKHLKRKVCKKCYSYLVPGKSLQVRTRASQRAVIATCQECGTSMRFPYRKEQVKKK